jgi:hypothetical protein
MKRVYRGLSLEEAEFLRMALRDAGIESILENEQAALYSELTPMGAPFGIIVADDHAETAAKVIGEVLQSRKDARIDENPA